MKIVLGMTLKTVFVLLTFVLSGHTNYVLGMASSRTELSDSQLAGQRNLHKYSSFTNQRKSTSRVSTESQKHLHLNGVEVPVYKFRGEDAQLECKYNRGHDPLYSVKWYKDDHEFYRYLFAKEIPKQTFKIPGIIVDVNRSDQRKVILKKLTFNSTGVYRCEVSADSPHFRTYSNHSVMVVVELPQTRPTISGGRSHYRVGETASFNCTSSRSKPAAKLTWLINGEPVEESSSLVHYYPWIHEDGLESRMLGLSFTVDKSHFLKGKLTLKCQATVAAIYSAFEEEGATLSDGKPYILQQKEHLIHVKSGSSTRHPSILAVAVVLMAVFKEQAIT